VEEIYMAKMTAAQRQKTTAQLVGNTITDIRAITAEERKTLPFLKTSSPRATAIVLSNGEVLYASKLSVKVFKY
jgi:hypothetical protein